MEQKRELHKFLLYTIEKDLHPRHTGIWGNSSTSPLFLFFVNKYQEGGNQLLDMMEQKLLDHFYTINAMRKRQVNQSKYSKGVAAHGSGCQILSLPAFHLVRMQGPGIDREVCFPPSHFSHKRCLANSSHNFYPSIASAICQVPECFPSLIKSANFGREIQYSLCFCAAPHARIGLDR